MRRYLATLGVVALGWTGAAAAGSAPTPDINSGFLGYCNVRPTLEATWSCYVNGLYDDIEQSKDPAAERTPGRRLPSTAMMSFTVYQWGTPGSVTPSTSTFRHR